MRQLSRLACFLFLLPAFTGCEGQHASGAKSHTATPAKTTSVSFDPAVPHTIQDAGFGLPFATITTPKGWGFNGGVVHADNCAVTGPSGMWVTESPDHLYGLMLLPNLKGGAASNPQMGQQFGPGRCPEVKTQDAAGFVKAVIVPLINAPGSNLQLVSTEPHPAALQSALDQLNQMNQQLMANANVAPQMSQSQITGDAVVMRFSATRDGRQMGISVTALTGCNHTVSQMLQYETMDCTALVAGVAFAPAEELAAFEKRTVFKEQDNPAWAQASQQYQQEKNARAQQQLMAQHQQNMADQNARFQAIQNAHAQQMAGYDRYNKTMQAQSNATHQSAQAYAAHMGDYNDYTNPNTGQTTRLSNQYGSTYVNSQGSTILQSNSAYAPGVDWTVMVPKY